MADLGVENCKKTGFPVSGNVSVIPYCILCVARLLVIMLKLCCMAGCQEDIDSLIRETSDATQLATWCTVYKVELARKRTECHSLTESLRKAKRELELMQTKLADKTTELSIVNGRNVVLEEDIVSQVCNIDVY